jgi:hypothetical protein
MTPFVKQLPKLDFSTPSKKDSIAALVELVKAGRITPVVDRTFPLSELPAALRHLESGRAREKIIGADRPAGRAPKKMKRIARRAHELSNLISEDHDLVLLAQRANERRDRFADETAADELAALG